MLARRPLRSALVAMLACAGQLLVGATPFLASDDDDSVYGRSHWSFQPIVAPPLPSIPQPERGANSVDRFVEAKLQSNQLSLSGEADRATLLRRLSFDLVGLPPSPEEVAAFVADASPDAWERAIDRYLASPRYGEHWGKYWLDIAGYADSNGYFNADSDRPLAYKYRDYVVRAFNDDKPFDRFITEQLAGDELSGYVAGGSVTDEIVELLTATHFLRNAQDGTSESDGNPEELRTDRATVLEGTEQITVNALLGLTIQCARCHAHKFEPIEHAEYYQLQAIFYPAFPAFHEKEWVKPKARVSHIVTAAEISAWEAENRRLDENAERLKEEFAAWHREHAPRGSARFRDDFDGADAKVATNWDHRAPGDDTPAGAPAIKLDSQQAPGAFVRDGALSIVESGSTGDRWLATKKQFDWTPDADGAWIQAMFELKADRLDAAATPAMRIGYFIAAHDFDDSSPTQGGNILIDGNPSGGAAVHLDYPGTDAKILGDLGESGYKPGKSYGVRVTNIGGGKFRLDHLVDGVTDGKWIELAAADLPDGGFAFEYCCGRSFIVDAVEVTSGDAPPKAVADALAARQKEFEAALKENNAKRREKPGALAMVTDIWAEPHDVHRLERGGHGDPAEKVEPAGLAVLSSAKEQLQIEAPSSGAKMSGRRLALARWLTKRGSRAAGLVSRVFVNRVWQHHFGTGIVATPDNFGLSGSEPSHPELIEHLADEFVKSGWSVKALHRRILESATYRQSSALRDDAFAIDHDNRLLWRFPTQRLSAEAIRDAMLTLSGELDGRLYGPYVPTTRQDDGGVTVAENSDGARRRGLYLQQRRTQVNTMLALFDTPVMVTNCAVRSSSTIPLQSLAMLNSEFVRSRAKRFAERLLQDASGPSPERARIERAFRLATGHPPGEIEVAAAERFLSDQRALYSTEIASIAPAGEKKASQQSLGTNSASTDELRAWQDFCQMLFAANAFLYVD